MMGRSITLRIIIILIICLGGLIYFSLMNFNSTENVASKIINQKQLSGEDFEINNIEWYKDGYLNVDWNGICKLSKEDSSLRVNFYQFSTSQKYNFDCKTIINGEVTSKFYGQLIADNFNRGENELHDATNRDALDPSKDNELKICCVPSYTEKEVSGEICDSIVLPARC